MLFVIVGCIHLNFSWSKPFRSFYSLRPSSSFSPFYSIYTIRVQRWALVLRRYFMASSYLKWLQGNERQVLCAMNNAVSVTQFYLMFIVFFLRSVHNQLGENEESFQFLNFFCAEKRFVCLAEIWTASKSKTLAIQRSNAKNWPFGRAVFEIHSNHFI